MGKTASVSEFAVAFHVWAAELGLDEIWGFPELFFGVCEGAVGAFDAD